MQVPQGLFGSPAQQQQGYAQTGANIGSALGRLFGLKDPALESRRIMSEVNYNDPVSLQIAAKELAGMGMIDQAMSLVSDSRKIEEQRRASSIKEREVSATEQQARQGDERLRIAGEDLQLKREKLEQDQTLTDVQVKKANAELDNLEKDYTPSLYKDNAGNALFNKRGEVGLFYFDDETNTIKRHKSSQGLTTIKPTAPNPYDFLKGAMAGQQPIAAAGQPQGQAGGSLADMQARAAQALKDRMNK